MSYSEKVEYLKKVDQLSTSDPEIQRRYSILKQEVYEFENNVFNVILKEIQSEKQQIEFLQNQIEASSNDELFKAYCDDKINQHKKNITAYGNQIYSMYTRKTILGFYTKRQSACQARVEYCQKDLESNPAVTKIALNDSLRELEEINLAINLLNGNDVDLLHSYINISEIGKKI